MIPRSYRNLLINLSRGFCKQSKKDKLTNDNQHSKNKVFAKKNKNLDNIKNESKANESKSKSDATHIQKNNIQNKQRRDFKDHKQAKTEKVNEKQENRFKWQTSNIDEAKLNKRLQQDKIRKNFQLMYEKNNLQTELIKDIQTINNEQHYTNIRNNMFIYVQQNLKKAEQFFVKNILPAKIDSEKARLIVKQINQQIIKKYIQNEDLQSLIKFVKTLGKNYQKNQGCLDYGELKILNHIQMLAELQQNPLKYQAINSIIKISKFELKKPEIKKRSQQVIKKTIQSFFNQKNQKNNETLQKFEQLLQTIISAKLLPQKFIKSNSFINILQKVYFNKCLTNQKYDSFFRVISSVSASVSSQDDHLESFFKKFYSKIQEKQIQSTDCQIVPFKVNTSLVKNYQQFLNNQNKQGALAIIAICLANNYLSIPEHFLQQQQKFFTHYISKAALATIKQQYNILKLKSFIKQNITTKVRQNLQNQLTQSKKPQTKIKALILTKNYEKAMEAFEKNYFKSLCIQKQRLIIKQVLTNFYLKQMRNQLPNRQKYFVKQNIEKFVQKLSQQYLWQSWKKSQDLGYLLEDYYIKQQDGQDKQVKEQKRFSYWQKYFETKRAKQINYYEKLNQLKDLKQPNEKPYIQNQFNLNQYLSEENYQNYRRKADENDNEQIQLTLYLYRLQYGIQQFKNNDTAMARKLLQFQNNLCENNLKLLQDFGLKDYDLSIHDLAEFQNRVANFKKFRGVRRLSDIFNRVYRYQDESQLFQFFKQQKIPDQIAKLQQQSNQQSLLQNEQLQKQQQNQATQPVSTSAQTVEAATQSQPSQAVSQSEATQQTQVASQAQVVAEGDQAPGNIPQIPQQPVSTHISTADPKSMLFHQPGKLKRLDKQLVDVLRIKRRNDFAKAAVNVKLKPLQIVIELIKWGVLNQQPMAIYMGQKLAMLTRQTIPHQLAIRVSDLLSHERQISQELFQDCKVCLTYIGAIRRQFIYDNNKKYQHIPQKPFFNNSTERFNKNLGDRLQDLTVYNPYLSQINRQPRELLKKASKGSLF